MSLVSALPDSHLYEPLDAKYVIPARYGAPLHKNRHLLRHQKDLTTLNAVLWDNCFQVTFSASKPSRHNTTRRGSTVPLRRKQMGNLTASPKFPIRLTEGVTYRGRYLQRSWLTEVVTYRGRDLQRLWRTEVVTYKGRYLQRSLLTEVVTYRGRYLQRSLLTEVVTYRGRYLQRSLLTEVVTYRGRYLQRSLITEVVTDRSRYLQRLNSQLNAIFLFYFLFSFFIEKRYSFPRKICISY